MTKKTLFDPEDPIYLNTMSPNLRSESHHAPKEFQDQFTKDKFHEFHVRTLPRKLIIESINVCNASCVFCAYQYKEEKSYNLDETLLLKAIKDYASFHPEPFVSLTPSFGDPLIDPGIFRKVKICKENGVKRLQFYTNGILLKKRLAELLDSSLDNLNISLADFDKTEYELIYRVKKYEDVLEGIHLLLKALKETGARLPVHLKLRSRRPLKEILLSPDYRNYIAPFVTEYVHISSTDQYDNWGGKIAPNDLPDGMVMSESRHYQRSLPCQRLYDIQLLPDGGVRLCGARRKADSIYDDLVIGNIYKESFSSIWTGSKFRGIAESFFTNQVPELCRDCSYYEAVGDQDRRTIRIKP